MTTASPRLDLVRAGDRRAMAALMRDIDDGAAGARDDVSALGGPGGVVPFVVGITGAPGAGKSTLVDSLIAEWRARGNRVGVVTIDPSSPWGGGAVLGDRVRMQRHATDVGVFIRSLATRGAVGGLSRSTTDVATILAAGGFSPVLVETVGVGQADVEIAGSADVTVVVTVPGLGDDVQTLKAGILEIADILVVNKSDRPGAEQAMHDLQAMLQLRRAGRGGGASLASGGGHGGAGAGDDDEGGSAGTGRQGGSGPSVVAPIVATVATSGQGVAALATAIEMARTNLPHGGSPRGRRRAEARIRGIVVARMEAFARTALAPGGEAAALADEVAALRLDPEGAAEALMTRWREGY